jgi:uncharacterized membrane protein
VKFAWIGWVGTALAMIGIGLGVYLTIAHYTTPVLLACPETGIVNCAKVTTSSYAEILGVPLALLGLLYFIAMLPLQLPVAWRSQNIWVRRGRLIMSASGILMIMWLIYVELFKLNAICLYCTGVHTVTLLLFILTVIGTALTKKDTEQHHD